MAKFGKTISSKGRYSNPHYPFDKNNPFLSTRAEGCKLDYLIYNFSGYLFYSIYNLIGFWGDASKNGTGEVEV